MVAIILLPLIALATGASATTLRSLADSAPTTAPPAAMCIREVSFDFSGEDIKNLPRTSQFDCCGECDKTPGCAAWTWSPYANGTCWLKKGRGKVIHDAKGGKGLVSSLLMGKDRNVAVCPVAVDTDFIDNDIGHISEKSPDKCIQWCRDFYGCRAFTWSDFEGGTCWMKSDKGQAVVKKGVIAGEAFPQPSCDPVCALDYNVDYVGNDIGSARSAAPSGCCAICSKTPNCRAYAWTNQNGGTCWLKNFAGKGVAKNGVVSAAVFPNPKCSAEEGVDYVGNDIANVKSADATKCCTACADHKGCGAYTWTDYQGGTCWLKSAKGSTVANAKAKSGVLQ